MNLNKKTKSFIVSIGIIVGFFLFKNPLFQLILKDDWVYKPSNNGVYIGLFNNYFWIILIGILFLILVSIIGGIILIIKGKPTVLPDGKKKMSSKRIEGIFLVIFPIILLVIGSGLIVVSMSGAKNSISGVTPMASPLALPSVMPMALPGSGSDLGFSVGGAKDVNNFRTNIKNNYLPISTDITYEGLFYDYYFDTGKKEECQKLFCPTYSYAISKDPISQKDNYYLAVGLNSRL